MGCGSSNAAGPAVADVPLHSPRRDRMASVSFAIQQQQLGAATEHTGTEREESFMTKRDSMQSQQSLGTFLGFFPAVDPKTDASYQHYLHWDAMMQALEIVCNAYEVNERECERARVQLSEKREETAAKKSSVTPATSGFRERRAVAGVDRPPTPTGYVTEEPSAASQDVKAALTKIQNKFSTFFGSSSPNDIAAGDETTNSVIKATPMSKYNAPAGSDRVTDSNFNAPSSMSMTGSMISAITRGSYVLGEHGGAEDEEYDEKTLLRTKTWTDDNIGVVIRVLELMKRRGSSRATMDDGCSTASSTQSSNMNFSLTSEGAMLGALTRLFAVTISVDPLQTWTSGGELCQPITAAIPEQSSQIGSTRSEDGEGAMNAGSGSSISASTATPTPRKNTVMPPTWNRQDNFLNKRNLDKLQERLALSETMGTTDPQKLDELTEGGTLTKKASALEAVFHTNSQHKLTVDDSPEGRKRALSRCDDNLLFQELV